MFFFIYHTHFTFNSNSMITSYSELTKPDEMDLKSYPLQSIPHKIGHTFQNEAVLFIQHAQRCLGTRNGKFGSSAIRQYLNSTEKVMPSQISFTFEMLRVCRRMFSNIASLNIPQISQRMSVNFLPAMEQGMRMRIMIIRSCRKCSHDC